MEFPSVFFVLCILIFSTYHKATAGSDFNVMNYGAVGNGRKIDSKAFSAAWAAACEAGSGATFVIPSGKTFLLSAISFPGPCNSSVTVQVDGNLVARRFRNWGPVNSSWITFANINGLTVTGNGQFDGRGRPWWAQPQVRRPRASLSFQNCNNLGLSGISSVNPPNGHISVYGSSGIEISNIHITAPKNSPNTDGIDISHGINNKIHDCVIATGDDCIAVSGGISFLNITNVTCGPGHGISIGSLGKDGRTDIVEEVHVAHCSFTGTLNGARIKTWRGGSGYARKISFQDITLKEAYNPIIIDQNYCDHACVDDRNNDLRISDVKFNGFRGTTSSDSAVTLKCSQFVGCTNIILEDVNMRSSLGHPLSATCTNAHGRSTAISPSVTCLN